MLSTRVTLTSMEREPTTRHDALVGTPNTASDSILAAADLFLPVYHHDCNVMMVLNTYSCLDESTPSIHCRPSRFHDTSP
jgi:hypothetical protein